jgi:hypothetical protein
VQMYVDDQGLDSASGESCLLYGCHVHEVYVDDQGLDSETGESCLLYGCHVHELLSRCM